LTRARASTPNANRAKVNHGVTRKDKVNPSWNFINPEQGDRRSLLSLAGHVMYLCEGHNNGVLDGLDFGNTNPLILNVYVGFARILYAPKNMTIFITGTAGSNKALECKLNLSTRFCGDSKRKIAIAHMWQVAKSW
jgi:hypothetical protein